MRLILAVGRLSTAVGRMFAWLMAVLTALIVWEVGSRYVFGTPHAWTYDAQAMAYGTLFMMAGAYTLATAGHVRGDVLYGFLSPRAQAWIDLVLYVAFFVPGVVALVWAGIEFAGESWAIREHSSVTADGPPIYPFKMVIPVAGTVLLLQGAAEVARCIVCLRTGRWPPRAEEVSEVDVESLTELRRDQSIGADDAISIARRERR
jgi:TRAP-type mannitol/chloroaromatic compound transport system permease small subunit